MCLTQALTLKVTLLSDFLNKLKNTCQIEDVYIIGHLLCVGIFVYFCLCDSAYFSICANK